MMRKLWISLPAFSPDYSGVCSAMYDLGGLTVIHDASGCTGNYTGYDEPRYYGSTARIFCSGLREIDAVLGRDDKLVDCVLQACADLRPTMITVLGSPVPMVIGTDFAGLAQELEARSGIPAFGFSTNGLSLYNRGVSDAMLALLRRFSASTGKRVPRGVNVLGVTPLDFGATGNAEALYGRLEDAGFVVLSRLMMGADLEQFRTIGDAAVNLVACAAGYDAARFLERKFGTPWVAALPTGDGAEAVALLEAAAADGASRVLRDGAREGGILIVAEQLLGNALRRCILSRSEIPVTVGTMFGLNPALASPGDLDIPDESTLREIVSSGRFRTLIGDPLFETLLSPEDSFIPLPHPAVSSKMHWDEVPLWLDGGLETLIRRCL